MRRVAQWVIIGGPNTVANRAVLLVDSDHSAAEAFEFFERFAFGGFDHESPGYWEGHCRSVEAEVDEAFGDVVDTHVCFFVHGSCIDDTFMCDESMVTGVENRVMLLKTLGDIICI